MKYKFKFYRFRKILNSFKIFIAYLICSDIIKITCALHLKGTFNTNEYFKFITRFGLQPTDLHNKKNTQGYIYGNISLVNTVNLQPINYTTRELPSNALIMLTLLDYNYFIDYYTKRLIKPETTACSMMFEKISKSSYFYGCNEKTSLDFIRRVPCANNKLCADEDDEKNVMNNFQFTFKTKDFNQARFWYISLVACIRDTVTCEWKHLSDFDLNLDSSMQIKTTTNAISLQNISNSTYFTTLSTSNPQSFTHHKHHMVPSYTIAYDIWLVNGHPQSQSNNPFEHQFSYELHDIFEIYLCSFIFYLFVIPFIGYRLYSNFHYLYLQLFAYTSLELVCRLLSIIHNIVFSFDGTGVFFFKSMSDLLEVLASSVLILILISIAKGWTIRSKRLNMSRKLYIFGFLLQMMLIISHMISLITVDQIFNTNSYETTAGYFEMSIRAVFMLWFLYELKITFNNLESAAFKNVTLNGDVTTSFSCEDDDTSLEFEIVRNGKKYQQLQPEETNTTDNKIENDANRMNAKEIRFKKFQKFYLHYGACCLVWFIYLPILIFITSFISELYRLRLVSGIRYFVNFISVIVLCYIMWSPKTPLKLPGKILSIDDENDSAYFFGSNYHPYSGECDDNNEDENVIYSSNLIETNSRSKNVLIDNKSH